MPNTTTVAGMLDELAQGCPQPPQEYVRDAHQRVEAHDGDGWPWPGSITGWWTSPDGITVCRLRLSGAAAARWVVFDPDRIMLQVQSGT